MMGREKIAHEPIEPITGLDAWASTLTDIATKPLEFCEDLPEIAKRYEAWWAQQTADRPIFHGTVNTKPNHPISRRIELLEDPEAWLAAKLGDMHQSYYVGDALPSVRVDFGPVLLGLLFGGAFHFSGDTTWTKAFINNDWSNAPQWTWPDDHPLWRRLRALLDMVAENAAGRYLVMTPDLGASADVLLNLRGSTELSMDVLDQPERIIEAIDAIYPAWRRAFIELYRIIVEQHGAGLVHWLGMWSNQPYHVPACDFSFMIGPNAFNSLCRPDIARQSATAGRAVFHLDGPSATRHIDALLEIRDIQAIQFTPGTGTPSVRPWLGMFERIQAAGRSLWIICPADEVDLLCNALHLEGLGVATGTKTVAELDDLYARFRRRYG